MRPSPSVCGDLNDEKKQFLRGGQVQSPEMGMCLVGSWNSRKECGSQGLKWGEGQRGVQGWISQCPRATRRPLNVHLNEMGSCWTVLSRKMTWSNLHFGRITLAAVQRIGHSGQDWEPGADFGSVDPGERWWFEPEGSSGRGNKWLHLASVLQVEPTGLAVLCEEKRGVWISMDKRYYLLRWERPKEKQFIFNYTWKTSHIVSSFSQIHSCISKVFWWPAVKTSASLWLTQYFPIWSCNSVCLCPLEHVVRFFRLSLNNTSVRL